MQTSMTMTTAVIGLGSNINPETNIPKALQLIGQEFKIVAISPLVTTKPIGFLDQADFHNGAVLVQTQRSMDKSIALLKKIEVELGRTFNADNKFGPRTIDLDLIVWDKRIVHDDFYQRDFLQKAVVGLLPEIES